MLALLLLSLMGWQLMASGSCGYRENNNVLSGGTGPITGIWHGKAGPVGHVGGNKHRLITGQHGLAEGHIALGLVLAPHRAGAVNAVRFAGERLLDFAVFVAVEPTVLVTTNKEEVSNLNINRRKRSSLDIYELLRPFAARTCDCG
jgi:hypothetical protein